MIDPPCLLTRVPYTSTVEYEGGKITPFSIDKVPFVSIIRSLFVPLFATVINFPTPTVIVPLIIVVSSIVMLASTVTLSPSTIVIASTLS